MNGFVKLHRRFCGWGWYKDIAVKAVFLDLLLNANYEPSEFKGHAIKRGDAVFGYASLAERSGVSVQQARTAIAKLKKTGEISVWSNRHLSVATIVKFDEYQQTINKQITNNQQTDNKQITNHQQTDNKQITSSKKIRSKEDKNVEELYPARAREEERDFDNVAYQVVNEFNRVCVDLPKVSKLTEVRKRLLFFDGMMDKPMEEYTALFEKVQKSDKLCGRGDLSWRADFDWIIKNSVKISEGTYDNVAAQDKPTDKNSRDGMYSAVGASFDLAAYERSDIFS